MADTLPPQSPPDDPVIPIGLGTKLGVAFSVVAAVAAALAGLLEGDQTPEIITLILAALGAAYKVLDGRYNQATAAIANAPQSVVHDHDEDIEQLALANGDADDVPPPTEDELRETFPEDPPVPEGAVADKPGFARGDV